MYSSPCTNCTTLHPILTLPLSPFALLHDQKMLSQSVLAVLLLALLAFAMAAPHAPEKPDNDADGCPELLQGYGDDASIVCGTRMAGFIELAGYK